MPKYSALFQKQNIAPISCISSLFRFRFPYRFPHKVLHWGPRRAWWVRYLQCGFRIGVIIGDFPDWACWAICRAKSEEFDGGPGEAQKAFVGCGPGGAQTASDGFADAAATVNVVFVTITYKKESIDE